MKSEGIFNGDPVGLWLDRAYPGVELSESATFGLIDAHIRALEAQSNGLQALVCELLAKNQELRAELAAWRLNNEPDPTASATHPQQHPGH